MILFSIFIYLSLYLSREPATTESTEFGARRRVPLTRTRTARPRPAASQQQEQSSAEQTNQRFNRYNNKNTGQRTLIESAPIKDN